MRDTLLALPKDTVLEIFRRLNAGSVGFDHQRVKKTDCVSLLLGGIVSVTGGDGTVRNVGPFPWHAGEVRAALDAMQAEGPAPASIPAAAPVPAPAAPVAPAAPAVTSGDPAAVLGALRDMLGVKVDAESVRSIVLDEVKKALDQSPVTVIEIRRPDGTSFRPSGHVRAEFQDILLDAQCGLNILLVGPAGSGKTHLAHQVAEALGRSFASISCTAGMSESVLSGWLLPQDGGSFDYVESDFVRLYEGGGVFLFDEVDAADPNTLLFINQALANGSFYLPQRKGRSLVKRHPDFVCIAAANTFGNGANGTYAGRERLDEAFLDRFRAGRHFVSYDTVFERKSVAPELLAWGWAIRKRIEELRMQRVMSTRFLLDATKLIKAGATFDRVKNKFFLDWKAEDRAKVDVA